MRVGVEVGGTFTDLVAIGKDGVTVAKVPSVPINPDEGAFNALRESGIPFDEIEDLSHGSTVATNAVLERKGYPTAFVTTEGFRDLLAMQRQNRTNIYDLRYQKPVSVIKRKDTFEVPERILANGTINRRLDESVVERDLIPALRSGGYQTVAICLLNGYANPEHERRLGEIIARSVPDILVTLASDITRQFREYERASTTALSAYVQPVIDRYIGRFEARLVENGFAGRFSVMQSNGGRLPAEGMRRSAISALLSGPAAGVVGATRQAQRSGYNNLITLDMGGTSTDVCLVADGRPELTQEFQIDDLPIRVPVIDINTVGAGGGSIIWVDDGGMLRAGPRSAGADPGPACYGRGGKIPTITDAHMIRGTIRPKAFLGGRMKIDSEASREVFAAVAEQLEMTLEEIADSAVRVANANIVRAIQLVSTERGKDPRDYVMVAFGGAGPLHAAQVADDLGIRTILVPPNAGVVSAFGLLASDFVRFENMTRRTVVDENTPKVVNEIFTEMRERVLADFATLGLNGDLKLDFVADMRFVGQAFEVQVDLDVETMETLTAAELRRLFTEAHQRIYFHGIAGDKAIEVVSYRLGVTLPLDQLPHLREAGSEGSEIESVEIYDGRSHQTGQIAPRGSLAIGMQIKGPALIEDDTSSILVPTGWAAEIDGQDNLIISRED
jgi:N-methylhydantoinase A